MELTQQDTGKSKRPVTALITSICVVWLKPEHLVLECFAPHLDSLVLLALLWSQTMAWPLTCLQSRRQAGGEDREVRSEDRECRTEDQGMREAS